MNYYLKITDDDQKWLLKNYPRLSISQENGIDIISGAFDFSAVYEDYAIQDTYQIRIELQPSSVSDLPTVIETEGRIDSIAKKRNIPIIDLHTNPDGTACLCLRLEESNYFPDGYSLPIFIEKLVKPFFYAQNYFENQNTWPWDTYSHGDLGWLEWYFAQKHLSPTETQIFLENLKKRGLWSEISIELSKKGGIKGHHLCLCGSKNKYRNCHPNVLLGLWKLQKKINKFGWKL